MLEEARRMEAEENEANEAAPLHQGQEDVGQGGAESDSEDDSDGPPADLNSAEEWDSGDDDDGNE